MFMLALFILVPHNELASEAVEACALQTSLKYLPCVSEYEDAHGALVLHRLVN